MKHSLTLLSILFISLGIYAAESEKIDPFARANELYGASNWSEAYIEFRKVHNDLSSGIINAYNMDEADFIRGQVNYADVIFAKAAGELNKGNFEKAKELMVDACIYWSYRIEGGQFGRKPLSNEWLPGQNIAGKELDIYSERESGAFGDTFYATWALQYAKEKGAIVTFIPQKPLAKLYDKQFLPNALQTQYVDQIALRDMERPKSKRKEIYLWSILRHYLEDATIEKPFPVKPCLSGTHINNEALNQKIAELTQLYGQEPFFVGVWWRSAGPAAMAADWRTLDRDPGAHRILGAVQDMPVLVINLEGLGRKPLSPKELKQRREEGTQGNSDDVDVTTYPTNNVFSFGPEFDRDIPFADTIGVMQMIKNRGGILIGCDTGLCNAAAMVTKDENIKDPSVLVILNKKADMRWSDDITSPRTWHHSNDVLVFQAQKQGKWNKPIAQARTMIEYKIERFLQQ